MKDAIVYEQPLNEVIRVCLRLEHVFSQIDHQLGDTTELGARSVIHSIINALHLLNRPDLKAKLAKELSYHQANLLRFGDAPEIDSAKLNRLIQQLEEHSRNLIDSNGKIGQRLREIELLNMLSLHLATPGGGCSFDLPIYYNWLQQSTSKRQATIMDWLNDFAQIRTIVSLILDLVRKNARLEQKTAVHGFHQELLDPQSNLRMIRIGITRENPTYPEISIGRHFFSVRFFLLDIEKRPSQFTDNLLFWVAYCSA